MVYIILYLHMLRYKAVLRYNMKKYNIQPTMCDQRLQVLRFLVKTKDLFEIFA